MGVTARREISISPVLVVVADTLGGLGEGDLEEDPLSPRRAIFVVWKNELKFGFNDLIEIRGCCLGTVPLN